MNVDITTKNQTPRMTVTEGNVTCVLKLGLDHSIDTTGEDIINLANRISYSYRVCVGKGQTGKAFLQLIKTDLINENTTTAQSND